MGSSPWGHKELDTTKQRHSLSLYTILLQHVFKRKDIHSCAMQPYWVDYPPKSILPRTSENGLTWKPGLCR